MNKKVLLAITITFLLSLITVQAALTDNIKNYYTHDTADISGSTTIDSLDDLNGTVTNINATNAGKINEALYFIEDLAGIELNNFVFGNDAFAINFWIRVNSTQTEAGDYITFGQQQAVASGDRRVDINYNKATNTINYYVGDGTNWDTVLQYATDMEDNTFHMLTFTYDWSTTNKTIYYDGTQVSSHTATKDLHNGAEDFYFMARQNNLQETVGTIDELGIWNNTLTKAEVTELYNTGSGLSYPFGPAIDTENYINISTTKPNNNTQYNTILLEYNITYNATNTHNITLYINNISNQTSLNIINGTNLTTSFNITFDTTEVGTFTYNFSITDGQDTDTTNESTIYIDNVNPTITWTLPSSANTTKILNGSYTTNIDINDTNLYSFQYNITWPNGTVIYETNINNLTGLTGYNINNITDMTNKIGWFNATVQVCDGHTKQEISFETVINTNPYMIFDNVRIYEKNKDTTYTGYIKNKDRYQFEFEKPNKVTKTEYIITSNKHIDILNGKTKYKGH